MKMKKPREQQTRSAGGGSTKPVIGSVLMNSDGPNIQNYKTQFPNGYHTGGYASIADNTFSSRLGLASTVNEDEEEVVENETLQEFFARLIKMPLTESEKKQIDNEKDKLENEELEEYSGAGAIAGVATPLGTDAQGNIPTKNKRKKQLKIFSKSFGGY
jgi:hypothetical protein